MEKDSSALEQFRQQWRQEVNARSKVSSLPGGLKSGPRDERAQQEKNRVDRPINKPPGGHPLADSKDDNDTQDSELIQRTEGLTTRGIDDDEFSTSASNAEPESALEHYERAVENESQGKLGDSLSHYRKAYRLDAMVDQSYKDKYFAQKWKPTSSSRPSDKPTTEKTSVINNNTSVKQVVTPNSEGGIPPTTALLVANYAGLPILGVEPIIPGDPVPPCFIKDLPTEVLLEILRIVALSDISVFTRSALVCKKIAFHVLSDNAIWKQVALGPEYGLASQKYDFGTDLQGRPVIFQSVGSALVEGEHEVVEENSLFSINETLFPKGQDRDQDWREVFHSHPRIRFSGVYISTVNYTRAGGASATSSIWGNQVHIVTYYRYLRFFRNGTVISLLSTHEPIDVVHHLTRENLAVVRPSKDGSPSSSAGGSHVYVASSSSRSGGDHPHHHHPHPQQGNTAMPPSAHSILKHALRGRWRLCHPSLATTDDSGRSVTIGTNEGVAGDLHIETEGVGSRYMYTMHLGLKSGSRSRNATKNNKLVWKGFWNYNHLTNDWGEFNLRNDKPFFFSRVNSYGLG